MKYFFFMSCVGGKVQLSSVVVENGPETSLSWLLISYPRPDANPDPAGWGGGGGVEILCINGNTGMCATNMGRVFSNFWYIHRPVANSHIFCQICCNFSKLMELQIANFCWILAIVVYLWVTNSAGRYFDIIEIMRYGKNIEYPIRISWLYWYIAETRYDPKYRRLWKINHESLTKNAALYCFKPTQNFTSRCPNICDMFFMDKHKKTDTCQSPT